MLKVNNRSTIARCEICSKLTIDTPERRHRRCLEIFIGNFEHYLRLVLVFLLLNLSRQMPAALTLKVSRSQNGLIHSNNSSAKAELALNRLTLNIFHTFS